MTLARFVDELHTFFIEYNRSKCTCIRSQDCITFAHTLTIRIKLRRLCVIVKQFVATSEVPTISFASRVYISTRVSTIMRPDDGLTIILDKKRV